MEGRNTLVAWCLDAGECLYVFKQTFMQLLICANLWARPRDPETIRRGYSPNGGYRLYQLNNYFNSFLLIEFSTDAVSTALGTHTVDPRCFP